ncbi:DinB family protein [Humisphaera borealis]|uniref:DinB family protein n=1 Tax=Humisphaera borealis TaxID=2807512 RepID=A0A7M2X1Q6_9BACT|nr:DinB family protein [Humisphaera borealis]QOV91605.1 DinB family protein [Humisphaera borealis]
MIADWINQYDAGPRQLRDAVAGLSREQLLWKPPADLSVGLWSIHQIVIHMADSDAIGVHRLKRVIAEDKPLLIGYDESAFVRSLNYDDQSADEALTLFELARRSVVVTLRKLPPDAFARIGIHNEVGAIRLDDFVHKYVKHLNHHLDFIRRKRAVMKV